VLISKSEQAKAEFLLQSIPSFYSNTVENIREKVYGFDGVSRTLRGYIPAKKKGWRVQQKPVGTENDSVVLAVNTKKNDKTCRYCKDVKGWAGRGHDESECFAKKREEKNADKEITKAETDNELIAKIEEVSNMETTGPRWQYDTAATVHTTNQKERLINPEIRNTWAKGHNGTWNKAELIGEIQFQIAGQNIQLKGVLYKPEFSSLINSQKITGRKRLIDDDNTNDAYLDVNGKRLFNFTKVGGKLMVYDEPELINTLTTDVVEEWHKRCGHLPLKSFYSIQEAPPGLAVHKSLECEACAKGKSAKSARKTQTNPICTTRPLERVYANLVGPMKTAKNIYSM
jgi:hypothetical protein